MAPGRSLAGGKTILTEDRPWLARRVAAAVACLLLPAGAGAHNLTFTDTRLVLRADRTFEADLTCDLDALALGVDAQTDSAQVAAALLALPAQEHDALPERLRELISRRVRIRFDGQPASFTVDFPERWAGRAPPGTGTSLFGLTAQLTGRIPEGARQATFWASRSFPPANLTISQEGVVLKTHTVLQSGEESPPFRLGGGEPEPGRLETALRYLRLGFSHIVPEGIDHVLFVLGLFLLSPRVRPLLAQVSAFTAAHTLTLALSTLGVFQLPSAVVEPLIALSIAYVAVENTLFTDLRPWRIALVFGFGLLHGLGFAGALGELGLPKREFITGLLSFNAGVELGQLAVLALAFLTIGLFRNRPSYRRRVVLPLSAAIAGVGLYWTVTRILSGVYSL